MLAKLAADDLADLVRQAGQPAGRQLFAADFEEQLAIHVRPSLSARGLFDVRLRDADGELSHAQNVSGPFGHADAVARVENVEQMRALEACARARATPGRP